MSEAAMNSPGKRCCANCCIYEGGECMNGLGDMPADAVCSYHKTAEEDRKDDEAMARFRAAIGLPPRKPV